MRRVIGKLSWIFCVSTLVLGFLCLKLDDLRTPRVLCIAPQSGVVDGSSYACVLPLECLRQVGDGVCVYAIEESTSYFHPLVARLIPVAIQAQDNENAAVTGIYGNLQIVRFSSRPLEGSVAPVGLWKEADK